MNHTPVVQAFLPFATPWLDREKLYQENAEKQDLESGLPITSKVLFLWHFAQQNQKPYFYEAMRYVTLG